MTRLPAIVGLVLAASSAFACSSFAGEGEAARPADDGGVSANDDASSPGPAQPDASTTDAGPEPTCPATSFCDGFERDDVRGEWDYPPSNALGESKLEIDLTTAASGTRSLAVTTAPDQIPRVNALTHTFVAVPTLPFEIHLALRVDELPAAEVRLLRVAFSSGSSVWLRLGTNGIEVGMGSVLESGGSSEGANPGELAPLGEWATYTLTVESTRVLFARDNGTRSAAIVPYVSEFGSAVSTEIGVVRTLSTTRGARFRIDDVVMPR